MRIFLYGFSSILILPGSKSFILIISSKKLVREDFYLYIFNTHFQFILSIQNLLNLLFVLWNGNVFLTAINTAIVINKKASKI